jgi:putative SOS response-associated peptidase YedK
VCRFYILMHIARLRKAMEVAPYLPNFDKFDERLTPEYYGRTTANMPIVRNNSEGKRILTLMRWGLLPAWAKDRDFQPQPVNARSETIDEKRIFREAFDRRRCLVPASAFYEWQGEKPPKQAYKIRPPGEDHFAMAGLWERWRASHDTEPLDTFTVVMTEANDIVRPIHERMPVILHPKDYSRWLDRAVPGFKVRDLLKPFDGKLVAEPTESPLKKKKDELPPPTDLFD